MFDELKTEHTPAAKQVRAIIPTELHDRLLWQAQYELVSISEYIERLLVANLPASPA